MAHTVEARASTPANDLRDLLDLAERQLPALDAGNIAAYLVRMDQIDALQEELAVEAGDLRGERTRWEDLQQRLAARASRVVKIAGRAGGLATLRSQNPPAEGPWWHLDAVVAARRRHTLRRAAIGTLVVAGVLLVASWAYSTFFAPSPETVLLFDTISDVERLVMNEEWAPALAAVEQTAESIADNEDLLLWGGVLAERLGDEAKAASFLERAERAIGDPLRYQATLGMRRIQAGDLAGAETAARAALEINPDEAQAYFLLANIAEARQQTQEALALYQRAADLAGDSNPQLAVVSKMRLGLLLQALPSAAPDSETTATPPAPP